MFKKVCLKEHARILMCLYDCRIMKFWHVNMNIFTGNIILDCFTIKYVLQKILKALWKRINLIVSYEDFRNSPL